MMCRRLIHVLCVALLGALFVAVPASPASACSCMAGPFEAAANQEFDYVAVAVVTALELDGPSLLDQAQDRLNPPENEDNDPNPESPYSVWTFRVDQVIDGSLSAGTVAVYAPEQEREGASGGNCALGIRVGDRVGTILSDQNGRLSTALCSVGTPEAAAAAFGVEVLAAHEVEQGLEPVDVGGLEGSGNDLLTPRVLLPLLAVLVVITGGLAMFGRRRA